MGVVESDEELQRGGRKVCITATRASKAREEGMMGVVHGGEEMIDEPGQAQDCLFIHRRTLPSYLLYPNEGVRVPSESPPPLKNITASGLNETTE